MQSGQLLRLLQPHGAAWQAGGGSRLNHGPTAGAAIDGLNILSVRAGNLHFHRLGLNGFHKALHRPLAPVGDRKRGYFAVGKNLGMDCLAISQISRLDKVPLNESEITIHFFMGGLRD